MSTELKIFNFENNPIRIVDKDENVWYILSDVCKILELSNPSEVKKRLKEDGLSSIEVIDSIGRKHNAIIINQRNLDKCVLQSRKERAIQFQDWILDDVLPSIRKTGSYSVAQSTLPQINSDFLKQIADRMAEQEKQLQRKDHKIEQQNEVIKLQSQTVQLYNQIANADGLLLLQDAGKALHLHPNKFIAKLEELGYFKVRQSKQKPLLAKQSYIDAGYFEIKTYTITFGYETKQRQQTYVTGKGLEYFRKKIYTDFADIMNEIDKARYAQSVASYQSQTNNLASV